MGLKIESDFRKIALICLIGFLVLFNLLPAGTHAAATGPRITLQEPPNTAIIHDDFSALVTVSSSVPIVSVMVELAGKTAELALVPSPCTTSCSYSGKLDLSDVPRGPVQAVYKETDATGGERTLTVGYNLNNPPSIEIASPLPFQVATPSMKIKAVCHDDDTNGCAVKASINGKPVTTGSDALDESADLSAYSGQQISFSVAGTDSAGQNALQTFPLYVETNPSLLPVVQGNGPMLDGDEERVVNWDAYHHRLQVRHLSTGVEETIPFPVYQNWNLNVHLTPNGVIGEAYTKEGTELPDGYIPRGLDPIGTYKAFKWEDGELIFPPISSVQANGSYLTYKRAAQGTNGNELMIENMVTREERVIDTMDEGDYVLTAEGAVVYPKGGQMLRYAYSTNQSETISEDMKANYSFPVSAGALAMYVKSAGSSSQVVLWDGQAETEIEGAVTGIGTFSTAGGWLSYLRQSSSGQFQRWVRSPQGDEQQLWPTSGGGNEYERLAPDGSMTFTYGGSLYISRIGEDGQRATPEKLTVDKAASFYQDGWNIYLGAAWYKVKGTEAVPRLVSLAIDEGQPLKLKPGDQRQLTVRAGFSDGSTRDVTSNAVFQSDDDRIVTIQENGILLAAEEGATVITAVYGGLSQSVEVVVEADKPTDPPEPEQQTADLDGNGIVDVYDMIEFLRAFYTIEGSMHYDARVDYNKDGIIDLIDGKIFMKLYEATGASFS